MSAEGTPKIPESAKFDKATGSFMAGVRRVVFKRFARPAVKATTDVAAHGGEFGQDLAHELTHDSDNPLIRGIGKIASGGTFLSLGRSKYSNRPEDRRNRT